MSSVAVLKPRMHLIGSGVHVQLEMSAVTMANPHLCMAVECRSAPVQVVNADSMDAMIPAIQVQDVDSSFKVSERREPTPVEPMHWGIGGVLPSVSIHTPDLVPHPSFSSSNLPFAPPSLPSHIPFSSPTPLTHRRLCIQPVASDSQGMVSEMVNHGQQAATVVAATHAIMEADIRPLHIIVFIANNTVTLKAVQTALYLARWGGWGVLVAQGLSDPCILFSLGAPLTLPGLALPCRPGRDTVHLATVVQGELQQSAGLQTLSEYEKMATRAMIDVQTHVLVRGPSGLLDCMEKYVMQQCKAGDVMVCMGSMQITSSVLDSVMGSVTLSFMKRLVGLPVVVVTQNSKNSPVSGAEQI
jgi:hypothetical protein